MTLSTRLIALATAAGLTTFAGVLIAQYPGLSRTIIQRSDVSFAGHEAVIARIEVAPGSTGEWHTHSGDEIDYVLEGEAELLIAGRPPRKVKAGDAFVIPAGTVHNARNSGSAPVRVIGVFVVEKNKPLATLAPAPPQ